MRRVLLLFAIASLPALTGCGLFRGPAPNQWISSFPGPRRDFRVDVLSQKTLRQQNVVMQKRDYSCGAATLATVIKYYWGDEVTEEQFLMAILRSMTAEQVADRIENGLTMTDLRRAAVKEGYLASMVRVSLAKLAESKTPVILRIEVDEFEHFVVFRGVADDRVFLADPVRGNIRIPAETFVQQWTDGVVLVVVKKGADPPDFSPLAVDAQTPVQHEMQAARRSLFLPPRW